MTISFPALKTEIQTDPRGYGYAPLVAAGSDSLVATLLNKVRDGTDGFAAITIRRGDIKSSELFESITAADWNAIATQGSRDWLQSIANIPTLRLQLDNGSDTNILAGLKLLFGAGTVTRTNLIAIATRSGSRTEELFGVGIAVTDQDIARALRG